jgi:hypothetical protein
LYNQQALTDVPDIIALSRKLPHSKIWEHDQWCSHNFLLDFDMPLALQFDSTQDYYIENRELSSSL